MQLRYTELLDHIYGEEWSKKCETIRRNSHFKDIKGWRLASFIMKAGEDIRKEELVMQVSVSMLIYFFESFIRINRVKFFLTIAEDYK